MNRLDLEIFTAGEPITGQPALQCIRSLIRRALWLKLVRVKEGRDESTEMLGLVVELVIRQDWYVKVDLPLTDDHRQSVYDRGDPLSLFWSDGGMRYAARAMVDQIQANEFGPTYLLTLERSIYAFPEKRNATRVPVSVHDHVEAALAIDDPAATIPVSVKDISTSGARLLIPLDLAADASVEPRQTGLLSLSLPGSNAVVQTPITVVWLERFSPAHLVTGCAWPNASDTFAHAVRDFISQKTVFD